MKTSQLSPNVKNPRKISAKSKKLLEKSLMEFGDLGSIIFNTKTKKLVGGHQRISVMPKDCPIVIETKYDKPTRTGTVAEGHVVIDGERFKYREVSWDSKKETLAMLAANKHGGEWDQDLLKVTMQDFAGLDFELAGFEVPEMPAIEIPTSNIQHKENITTTKEDITFDEVKEETKPVNKRYVLVIDCPNDEVKNELRAKIEPDVTQALCKIF